MSRLVESFVVLTTLLAQRIVAKDSATANTVVYPASKESLPLGVTLDTVLDTTSAIPVQCNGRAKVYFNDTVAAGALVAADTSGRGIPFVMPNTTTSVTLAGAYAGILLGPAVAATGAIQEILINPGYVRQSV